MQKTLDVSSVKISYNKAYDYGMLKEYLEITAMRYSTVSLGYIGTTVGNRGIPVVRIGADRDNRGVMYVGGISASDRISPAVLLRFICDYAEFLETGKRLYSVNLPYLFENRTVHIIPMLNPDGYEIRALGADGEVLSDRLNRISGGDFSNWTGNGRGADLNNNFSFPGKTDVTSTDPDAEPEVFALCNYIRLFEEISVLIGLRADFLGIRYFSGGKYPPRSRTIGRLLSRMTGTPLLAPSETEEIRGGCTDWFIDERNKPAFDCGCKSQHETPDYFETYAAYREALFSAPLLI